MGCHEIHHAHGPVAITDPLRHEARRSTQATRRLFQALSHLIEGFLIGRTERPVLPFSISGDLFSEDNQSVFIINRVLEDYDGVPWIAESGLVPNERIVRDSGLDAKYVPPMKLLRLVAKSPFYSVNVGQMMPVRPLEFVN